LKIAKKIFLKSRYRARKIRSKIENLRVNLSRIWTIEQELTPFWSVFLTFSGTANCSYCVQNYSFLHGRKDSPLKGTLKVDQWLKINDINNKPESLVIQGGEPLLYKDIVYVLEGLHTFKQLQVVTNLTKEISLISERVNSIRTHSVKFECSFHENAIDFKTFVHRALTLKESGLLGSVRIVDVNPKKTLMYISKFADYDINLIPLYQIGFTEKGKLSVYDNEEASNLIRKPPVLCKVAQVLFSPNGDIYNCCTKLYWGDQKSSFGNLVAGFEMPNGYYVCHDFGFCNPCQIGYMDVRKINENISIKVNKKVLLSNPPAGVQPSKY
jgi:sulfatase maturation enzyme AslB (radical SAM superfamily)